MGTPTVLNTDGNTLGTEIVKIYVGPKRKLFIVHKKPLCERSSYFSKAFNSGFKESNENEIHLEEENDIAFDALVNWIYRDKLPCSLERGFENTSNGWRRLFGDFLLPMFIMAEKFCLDELCNKIMDAIQDGDFEHDLIPSPQEIRWIYENTHGQSQLRKYCAIMHLRKASFVRTEGDKHKDLVAELLPVVLSNPDLGVDLAKLLLEYGYRFYGQRVSDPQLRTGPLSFGQCFFHTHLVDDVCYLESIKTTE